MMIKFFFAFIFLAASSVTADVNKTSNRLLIKNDPKMSLSDCNNFALNVWEKRFKPYTLKPILIDFTDGLIEQKHNALLNLSSQTLLAFYWINNQSTGQITRPLIQTSNNQFFSFSAYATNKNEASCAVFHTWTGNSSMPPMEWIMIYLKDAVTGNPLATKKIIYKP